MILMSRFALRRPAMGHVLYLLLFALYIALFLNIAFFKQAFSLLPVDSLHNALVFATMPLVLFCIINILVTLASLLWLTGWSSACLFC
jgi:lipid A ethanolaminephosphotransferase